MVEYMCSITRAGYPLFFEKVLLGSEPVHEFGNTAKHLLLSFPLYVGGTKCITRRTTMFLSLAALGGGRRRA